MEGRSVAGVGRRLARYTWEGTFWSDSNFHTWIEMVITQMCTYMSKAKEQNALNGGILVDANPTSKKLILNGKKTFERSSQCTYVFIYKVFLCTLY